VRSGDAVRAVFSLVDGVGKNSIYSRSIDFDGGGTVVSLR
jgi:hypothetical protein